MPMAGCHKSRGKYIVTAENTESAPDVVKPVILPCPKPGEPLVLPAASWNVIRFVKG